MPEQPAPTLGLSEGMYIPTPCEHESCGRRRTGPGRARAGWLTVRAAAEDTGPWFCSWYCLSRYAIRAELRGVGSGP